MLRRKTLILATCLLLASCGAFGQAWPAKPIRLIVGDAPGSAADLRARLISPKLGDALGQPVVVDNRPGGNMQIAAEAAAKAPADGHTLFFGNIITHAINPLTVKNL